MDYTMSVYLPEIAMQSQQHVVAREELGQRVGLTADRVKQQETPLLVQLLQQMRQGGGAAAGGSPGKQTSLAASGAAAAVPEENKMPNTSKSPFRSSNEHSAGMNKSPGGDDDIEEDIVQDHEDIQL